MMNRLLVLALAAAGVSAGASTVQDGGKKAYVLVQVDVADAQRYGEYTKLSPGIIAKFGGRFLARGGRTTTLEGTPARGPVLLIQVPRFEPAHGVYKPPHYQTPRKGRAGAATGQFVPAH